MAYKALGLIEVRGMLASVLSADAALKAADVVLVGNRRIRGGLTTVQLLGDVAAVYAAVEAGVEAVKDTNCLISSHVIPNMDEQVERMLMATFQKKEKEETEAKAEQPEAVLETALMIQPEVLEELEPEVIESAGEVIETKLDELKKLKVVELRSLAYKHDIKSLTKKEIKYANKDTLIKALLQEGVKDE